LIHGLGALHLEIVEGRLRDEFQVNFEFGRRRVTFKEGLGSSLEGSEVSDAWETEVFGKPVTIRIVFEVRPLEEGEVGDPVWDGNVVVDQKGKPLPLTDSHSQTNPLPNIARGIASALSISPHTSLPISGTYVKIRSLHLPSMQIPPSVLTGAGATILRNYLRAAGMGSLMEPYITLNVNVNEDNLGRVIKDLTEHEAEVSDLGSDMMANENESEPFGTDGVYIPPDWLSPSSTASVSSTNTPKRKQTVKAVAPLSRMLDYSTRLRALSGGHGTFEMSPAGFRTVSESRKLEILREIGLSS
jgi:elongation factor G